MNLPETLTLKHFLTAGETDATGHMPVTLIVARAIEAATKHANSLDLGYSALMKYRLGWVLARISLEVIRYPEINEEYSITTWIASYNKYFSNRCFVLNDAQGNAFAHIRTMWVAINIDTRQMGNLTDLPTFHFPIVNCDCPIGQCKAPQPQAEILSESGYTFTYTDLDFNRHVNTIKYLYVVLNQQSLDFYDTHSIHTLEVSFDHECYFGQSVKILSSKCVRDDDARVYQICANCTDSKSARPAVSVRITYNDNKPKTK